MLQTWVLDRKKKLKKLSEFCDATKLEGENWEICGKSVAAEVSARDKRGKTGEKLWRGGKVSKNSFSN